MFYLSVATHGLAPRNYPINIYHFTVQTRLLLLGVIIHIQDDKAEICSDLSVSYLLIHGHTTPHCLCCLYSRKWLKRWFISAFKNKVFQCNLHSSYIREKHLYNTAITKSSHLYSLHHLRNVTLKSFNKRAHETCKQSGTNSFRHTYHYHTQTVTT